MTSDQAALAPRHGTRRCYQLGCRCLPCALAQSRYHAGWKSGDRRRVAADVVRSHLVALLRSGWTRADIADAARASRTTVWGILSGRLRTVNRDTAQRLMEIVPPRREIMLPAEPIIRLIAKLCAQEDRAIVRMLGPSDARTYQRARLRGTVSDRVADRWAVQHLGMTLDEIYGPSWDDDDGGSP